MCPLAVNDQTWVIVDHDALFYTLHNAGKDMTNKINGHSQYALNAYDEYNVGKPSKSLKRAIKALSIIQPLDLNLLIANDGSLTDSQIKRPSLKIGNTVKFTDTDRWPNCQYQQATFKVARLDTKQNYADLSINEPDYYQDPQNVGNVEFRNIDVRELIKI